MNNADYLTFPEDECVEIIDGHIYKMAAAPSRTNISITN